MLNHRQYLDSYSSVGLTPPLPPLKVAETDPDTHTSETSGFFVIDCATGWDIVFQVTVFQPLSTQPVPEVVLLVLNPGACCCQLQHC